VPEAQHASLRARVEEDFALLDPDDDAKMARYASVYVRWSAKGVAKFQYYSGSSSRSTVIRSSTSDADGWRYIYRKDSSKGESSMSSDLLR